VTPKKAFDMGHTNQQQALFYAVFVLLVVLHKSYKMFNEVLQLPFIMASRRYKSQ
jgi:hypothetical protein